MSSMDVDHQDEVRNHCCAVNVSFSEEATTIYIISEGEKEGKKCERNPNLLPTSMLIKLVKTQHKIVVRKLNAKLRQDLVELPYIDHPLSA